MFQISNTQSSTNYESVLNDLQDGRPVQSARAFAEPNIKVERLKDNEPSSQASNSEVPEAYRSPSTNTCLLLGQSLAGQQEYSSSSPTENGHSNLQFPEVEDAEKVQKFMQSCLMGLQQMACKILAKVLIKAIQPGKKIKYPYSGRSKTAPLWWPPLPKNGRYSRGQENCVRHIEPDHLSKAERLQLLQHIIQLAATPARGRSVFLDNDINVAFLRKVANKAMADWFNNSDENRSKRHLLDALFRMAKIIEDYRENKIGDSTQLIAPIQGGDTLLQIPPQNGQPGQGDFYDQIDEVGFQAGLPVLYEGYHNSIGMANTMQPPDYLIAIVNGNRFLYVPAQLPSTWQRSQQGCMTDCGQYSYGWRHA